MGEKKLKIAPPKNKESVIDYLEHYLDLAKKGEVVDIGIVAVMVDGFSSTAHSGGEGYKIIGAFHDLAYRICHSRNDDG